MDTMTKRIRQIADLGFRLGNCTVILSRGYRVSVPVAAHCLISAAARQGRAERSGSRLLQGGTAPWPARPGTGTAGPWW